MSVERMTPYHSVHPLAIVGQLERRVRESCDDGTIVGVVACVIEKTERGNNAYTVTCSPMAAEVGHMASYEINRKMIEQTEYEGDDRPTPQAG